MSFDGVAEEAAIRAKMSELAGGRVHDDAPDDEHLEYDEVGKVRPYMVLSIGTPFPDVSGGRAFGEGEQDIPYILTVVVGCYAGDRETLNMLYRAVVKRLVGWTPVEDNDTPLAVRYAVNQSRKENQTRPKILSKIIALRCTINLQAG